MIDIKKVSLLVTLASVVCGSSVVAMNEEKKDKSGLIVRPPIKKIIRKADVGASHVADKVVNTVEKTAKDAGKIGKKVGKFFGF
jgi:hypothetical protein